MTNPAKTNEELAEELRILRQEQATMKESYAAYVALSGQKEEMLKKSEEKFRSLFEGAPDAIILADPVTGKILDANKAAVHLLLRPIDEIIGMAQHELHPAQAGKIIRKNHLSGTWVN